MTSPTNICLVTGRIVDGLGNPAQGLYSIVPSVDQFTVEGSSQIVSLNKVTFMLDEEGEFAIPLIASTGSEKLPVDALWTLVLPATDQQLVTTITFRVPIDVAEAKVTEHVVATGNARSTYYRNGIWSRI